ncbi:rab effector MyRIP isoform X1 [Tachyglossus aculeatus]|uniref:rab effector MyRIP isoform X1 n=1 Tax=Tachyglossus aculeatus TaxID=9261 RepID=UPI0018F60E86|nr:rab effector MyRIP isoform X1 [Tachyglossus aculeatus]
MGRKLDLSGLTDDETEHVLQVVQRDFNLRKKEEQRLSEMKQKLDEEGSKCRVLCKHQEFTERCCMRCCSPFTFLLNSKRQCRDCKYNICKGCGSYQKPEKAWLCHICQQTRLLRTQSLEWYYNNVKSRFKRFGSAKVLKNLYRKHRLESGACSDIIEGSLLEGNLENGGNICGNDSTFYRQSEGHSMVDTLAVALRVAEEAVEEAISKAEAFGDSLDKQNEACYLREHKEELIEELASTIVQKIIKKQKNKRERPVEAKSEWPQPGNGSLTPAGLRLPVLPAPPRGKGALWRSQSAFTLPVEDVPSQERSLKSVTLEVLWSQQQDQVRKQKERRLAALPSWKSVDRLDETSPAPALQSVDGNWMALQNAERPRPGMLAQPKSPLFWALEEESSMVSAYDEMGTDSEDDFDWNAALHKLSPRPRHPSENSNGADSQGPPDWAYGRDSCPPVTSPSSGLYTNTETVYSDSETSSLNSSREARGPSAHPRQQRKPPGAQAGGPARGRGELDVNFNPQASSVEDSESSEAEEGHYVADKRARRWRRPRGAASELGEETTPTRNHGMKAGTDQMLPNLSEMEMTNENQLHSAKADLGDEKLKSRLFELAAKMSEKETSYGEERESEPRTESENRKESLSSEDNGRCLQEELKKKYSAVSLCNISTEVLKVINATEELIAETAGPWDPPVVFPEREKEAVFPMGTNPIHLDEQLTSLEENVYLTAGTVYGLEGQLNHLENAARRINSVTTESELADLEDQVATAAAQVHDAELQISDIESRISALTIAGLNVAPCVRLRRKRDQRQMSQVQTIDTSRQQRRKLPAPPVKNENAEASPGPTGKAFNRNFVLQGSLTQRTKERKSPAQDLMDPTKGSAVMY